MNQNEKLYDLEGRTTAFGILIIKFCKKIKQTPITIPLITQILRSGTSIGANYMEANGAISRKDFANKIFICKKEAQETKYWLKLIEAYESTLKNDITILGDECQQLILIFQKIGSSLKNVKL